VDEATGVSIVVGVAMLATGAMTQWLYSHPAHA
jgi:hypothetical protein